MSDDAIRKRLARKFSGRGYTLSRSWPEEGCYKFETEDGVECVFIHMPMGDETDILVFMFSHASIHLESHRCTESELDACVKGV